MDPHRDPDRWRCFQDEAADSSEVEVPDDVADLDPATFTAHLDPVDCQGHSGRVLGHGLRRYRRRRGNRCLPNPGWRTTKAKPSLTGSAFNVSG
ncbi:hypothetical protein ACIHCV_22100 [Streptomyces sp. NPDC051956]|uniref:hypothetical protein n=1 Tax=Streptomyces sp. NPDC051956 TaxID=3365677 RepID=UPI0037D8FCD4